MNEEIFSIFVPTKMAVCGKDDRIEIHASGKPPNALTNPVKGGTVFTSFISREFIQGFRTSEKKLDSHLKMMYDLNEDVKSGLHSGIFNSLEELLCASPTGAHTHGKIA